MSQLEPSERGAIEALLFVSDEPVSAARIAEILELPVGKVSSALNGIAEEYRADERGFQLREVAGGWRLYTHPAYHDQIEQYVLSWDTRKLSQAALEALSVIAYHQPVARAGVNAVRGVNSEAVISSLIEKGLVREVGRSAEAGNAILYGTTRTFLEKFGLRDLDGLPPLEEFAPDPRVEQAIRERLGTPTFGVPMSSERDEDGESADQRGDDSSAGDSDADGDESDILGID